MTSHTLYHTTPQYLWCHIHFRHDITHPVSDIAPTVSLWPQAPQWYHTHFWMTSHPPSVWHHMRYIEHHIQSLCHHTTVIMTSQPLYMKLHPVCRSTYTLYETSEPLSVSSHPLYRKHHNQSLYAITLEMCMASFALYKSSHPHFMTSDHRVFSSHTLYWTSCPLYLCHHLHCIDDITRHISLRSHPI